MDFMGDEITVSKCRGIPISKPLNLLTGCGIVDPKYKSPWGFFFIIYYVEVLPSGKRSHSNC